ncbi:ubiquinone biosynthesis accessory factor UbiJ [Gallibacterium sp. ZY190522]
MLSSIKQQLMLPQLVNGLLEQAINYLIERSEGVVPRLRKLSGKVLLFRLKQGGYCYLLFSEQRLDILAQYDGEADCEVSADAWLLLKRPKKSELSELINQKQVVFQGDLQVLQDTVALFEQLEKDPEELLAPYLGDVAAYSLTQMIRQIKNRITEHYATSERHWGERLTEEWRLIAPSLALVHFYDQVSELQQDLQRVENKINQLAGRL